MIKKLTMIFAVLAIVFGFSATGALKPVDAAVSIQAGDLVRGQSFSAVYYYGVDGFRYVFPNDKTYFTWFDNFDNVKFISDADLGKIQIGGNVTYKPGSKMVKITTDPRTYAVSANGELRHVTTESVAIALYGSDWNTKIDDVPDAFFTNYFVGNPINSAGDYSPAAELAGASTIGNDKGMMTPKEVTISAGGFKLSNITAEVGRAIRFTNTDSTRHAVTGDDLNWGSGSIQPGENYIFTFDNPGTYSYFDSLNSSLTGAITVVN